MKKKVITPKAKLSDVCYKFGVAYSMLKPMRSDLLEATFELLEADYTNEPLKRKLMEALFELDTILTHSHVAELAIATAVEILRKKKS